MLSEVFGYNVIIFKFKKFQFDLKYFNLNINLILIENISANIKADEANVMKQ